MVGIINLKTGYRFVTCKEQLDALMDDAMNNNVTNQTIFIDAELVADGRTRGCLTIQTILSVWRHFNLNITFIKEERRPIYKRFADYVNSEIKVSITTIE